MVIFALYCLEQDEVVEEKMTQLVSAETLAKLGDANWKERLAAVEKMTDVSTFCDINNHCYTVL